MELPPAAKPPAAIVDASLVIGYCARESNKYAQAKAKLEQYANDGWQLFAPGVMIGEVLYILCKKEQDANINAAEHAEALRDFLSLMGDIDPPPSGDSSLIARAEQIRSSFGCASANDSLYLALAEQLLGDRQAELVTFDGGFANQARANAPTVIVDLLAVI